ncbi:hypothetical protein [Marimonas arenosa]|uniref:Uncharacterized protein n=1 Tax=Marimonas arenosa TaxID=1795305 RepID=A0AAE4B3U1_9RHOB|nr:hypothetical protein [Marimonas arenosa]MDQ2089557.1 hypothetical protein [Marimonas arenosa]
MSRKFITLIAAASLAVAGLSASQAQATDKRTRNVILGATALAILGAAMSRADENRSAHVATHDRPRPRGHGDSRHGHGHGHSHHGYSDDRDGRPRGFAPGVHPRPVPPRVIFSELPNRCSFTVGTSNGTRRFFEKRCLERNYRFAGRLPQACRKTVRLGSRKIEAYGGGCLRERTQVSNWNRR